jgi:hypothetical protein
MKVTRFHLEVNGGIMSVEQAIKNAMLVMLRNRGINAIEVTKYEEETVEIGGCETCWDEYAVVIITYITETGVTNSYEYDGEFGKLIQELDASS